MAAVKREAGRALVVGLGTTGLSCVRHLVARGYDVSVVDSRAAPPGLEAVRREYPALAVHAGALDASCFRDTGLLVVSPGVSLKEPAIAEAIARGAQPIGDIELFAREARAPVLAITGANGKSTVTALVGAICRASGLDTRVGGNIGVPALSLLEPTEPDVYVLELSSFQLETTWSLNARAAAVLNLTPDHLDRYASLEEYARAKERIYAGDGTLVLNADDAHVMAMARADRRVVHFSLGAPKGVDDLGLVEQGGETFLAQGGRPVMAASEVPLPGRHNLANVLAALALTESMGVRPEAQREAVRRFKGLPHRTELLASRDGIRWINDSKGTNVGATVAALDGMTSPVVLIAGGDGKGQDFRQLADAARRRARAIVLIGRDAPLIEAALGTAVPVVHARDLPDAVHRARDLARSGDVVLLSPACASFDMFRNYEHRGEVFRVAVRGLLG